MIYAITLFSLRRRHYASAAAAPLRHADMTSNNTNITNNTHINNNFHWSCLSSFHLSLSFTGHFINNCHFITPSFCLSPRRHYAFAAAILHYFATRHCFRHYPLRWLLLPTIFAIRRLRHFSSYACRRYAILFYCHTLLLLLIHCRRHAAG